MATVNCYRKWAFDSTKLIKEIGGNSLKDNFVEINTVSTISSPTNNSLMFATTKKFKEELLSNILNISDACILIEPELSKYFSKVCANNHVIVTDNARLYFAKALNLIIDSNRKKQSYITRDNCIVIGANAVISDTAVIEPGAFIDNDVFIGENVVIKSGVRIRSYCIIKDNVVIGENSVIGCQGFGVETDTDGKNIRIPHIGGVLIEENVEVGALTSIAAGTIQPTIIKKNSFIDDLNHIAHNCYIGEGTMTTGCIEMGGSSKIGKNGYIAPNSTIRNGIELGDNCFIGQASSVQKSFGDNTNLVGSPARPFERK